MKLVVWRKQQGWTQIDLARRLSKSKPFVSGIENENIAVTTDVAIAIDRLSRGAVSVAELRPDLHDVRVLHDCTRS